MAKKKTRKVFIEPTSNNFFASPHGGRPPSDEVVRKATFRYVLEAFCAGFPPSPEWRATHNIHTWRDAVMAADTNRVWWSKGEFP